MTANLDRRQLLHLGASAGLGYLFTGPAFSVARAAGSNERVRVAGIGVGGKGSSDIDQASQYMEVAALCDIDDGRLGAKAKQFPHAKTYFDYRTLFDEMAKEFDACVISTADHSHAPAGIMAMRAGKHVYVQKPLTHTPFEARLMRKVAAEKKVCTQMGNQGSALNGLRRAVELIHNGVLGQITEAHVWTNRPAHYWKQSPDIVARPKQEAPVPKGVHWDIWIGPAPMRPYALSEIQPGRPVYHPHDWRAWWDFGTGAMGDMACHTANMAFRAMKLGAPTTVSAKSAELNPETYPAWARMTFAFPKRGPMDACVLHWYEGSKDGKRVLPPEELLGKLMKPGEKLSDSGSILVGTKGVLFSPNDYGARFRLTPEKDFEGLQLSRPEKGPLGVDAEGANDLYMKKEWFEAIKAGKPEMAASNFDYAGQLTETMLLGNIAVRAGKGEVLQWDAEKMAFTNSEAGTRFVSKEYRKGWDWLKS